MPADEPLFEPPVVPETFKALCDIARANGVSKFKAGPYEVEFATAVTQEWARVNRPIVDGRPGRD